MSSTAKGDMRYKGSTQWARADSELAWQEWWHRKRRKPYMKRFAVCWVELMEPQAHMQRTHVRSMAAETLAQTRAEVHDLTDAEVREVILILYRTWYLGLSLRNWGKRHGLLRPDD